MSKSDSSFEMFSSDFSDVFNKRKIFESKISIVPQDKSNKKSDSSQEDDFSPTLKTEFPPNFHNPGVDFFNSPPLYLERDYSYENPKSNSNHEPDTSLFTFDKEKLGKKEVRMKDAISHSPPLVSIFPNHENQVFDPRIETNPFDKYKIGYFSLKFSGFMPDRFVEPIFVNLFLWDSNLKKKVTETWRFFVEYPNVDAKIKEFFNPIYENSPKEVVMPKPLADSQIYVIVHLDRLLYHHNGSNLNKYYEKPSNKILLNQAKNDTSTCMHKDLTSTFAWSVKPFQEILSSGNEKSDFIKFQTFYFTQSVNDNFITNNISQFTSNKKSDKPLTTFQVWFDKGEPKKDIPCLLQYFDIPRLPLMKYDNTLIIHPHEARFKFPRANKGKNIYASMRIYSKYDKSCYETEKPLKLFNNGTADVYVTRLQYHVEHPYFNEEIIVHLPPDLPTTAILKVDFTHASLKKDTKQLRSVCGTAICPLLSPNGAFIGNGIHSFGISFGDTPTEKTEPTDSNRFTFEVILRSSIYSSSNCIASLFNGKVDLTNFDISQENFDFVIANLYAILDALIEKINDGEQDAFFLLMRILSFFRSDRNINDNSQLLVIYLNKYALRNLVTDNKEPHFINNFIKFYYTFIDKTQFSDKRSDFCFIWFILELMIKGALLEPSHFVINDVTKITMTLTHYLYEFRKKEQSIGQIVNRSLALFYKDLLEIPNIDKRVVFKMIERHLAQFGRKIKDKDDERDPDKQEDKIVIEKSYDRKWFRDFFKCLVTPKIFSFIISPYIKEKNKDEKEPKEQNTLFNLLFLPIFESEMNCFDHTDKMFKYLYRLLLSFDPDQYKFIAKQMIPLLFLVGRNKDIIKMYESKHFQIHIFIICHFILYYAKFDDFSDELADCCALLIKEAVHSKKSDFKLLRKRSGLELLAMNTVMIQPKVQFESSTQNFQQAQTVRRPSKHKKNYPTETNQRIEGTSLISEEVNEEAEKKKNDFVQIFDAIAFCIQSIMAVIFDTHQCVKSLNAIVSNLLDVEISPLLMDMFNSFLELLVKDYEKYFLNPTSNVKHIFRKLFYLMDEKKLKIIESCYKKEKQVRGNTILTDALVARSLYKVGVSDELLELLKNSTFKELAMSLNKINKHLANEDLKINNYDVYSDLLFQKAELLSASPDARVSLLLELASYHTMKKYVSEAVISQITAAALVAEYLTHLKRIPHYFVCKNPATMFCIAAPSAISEICPDDKVQHLPDSKGFCSSKYFCEYGLLCLLLKAVNTCKLAELYEITQKFHSVLTIIAEYRHLWQNMSRYYLTVSFAWQVTNNSRTADDRSLGNYYLVQFMDGKTYIYRETMLANIWEVLGRLKQSTSFISEGKEVVVTNEGEQLDPSTFEPNKYYVHLKSVQQYFTSEERKERVTVFEQNHNISQFYFDIPLSKSNSIEHCSLKRTIITIPHPLPYIVKRVEVPKENIKSTIFSPIEYSIQNLQKQIDLIEEACARMKLNMNEKQHVVNLQSLQRLIQGTLLVQVNEGPKKIAEVFLGSGEQNSKTRELRNIFRKFIEANVHAVKIHSENIKNYPNFRDLQDELDSNLNGLMSSLQPYLT